MQPGSFLPEDLSGFGSALYALYTSLLLGGFTDAKATEMLVLFLVTLAAQGGTPDADQPG